MTRFKGILKKIPLALIALALVLLAAYSLLNYYWGRQIKTRLAALKAAGQPISLADLHRQSVPERDNAAQIYERACKALSDPAAARDIYALDGALHPPSGTPSPADWAKAKSVLARFNNILLLIEGAQSKPACQFPPSPVLRESSKGSAERYAAMSLERYKVQAGLRDATRLLCARAILCAREGKTEDMVRYIKSAFKMSDTTDENATIVDYLVGAAVIDITLTHMRQALSYCQPSEPQLRQLDDVLSRLNERKLYEHGIECERAHFLNWESGKAGPQYPLGGGDTLAYLDFISRNLESGPMNYSAALSKRLVGPSAADTIPFYAIITRIIATVTARAADVRYKCEAQIACGRTFLALRAYKAHFGEYPRTLRVLKSGIGWELPKDPFTGKDLVYKRTDRGFVLYSVAYDLKDNGGTPLRSGDESQRSGDIVCKVDR